MRHFLAPEGIPRVLHTVRAAAFADDCQETDGFCGGRSDGDAGQGWALGTQPALPQLLRPASCPDSCLKLQSLGRPPDDPKPCEGGGLVSSMSTCPGIQTLCRHWRCSVNEWM
ncbi:hypothetical protein CapIbe_012451 [Capra ibex]